MSRYIDADKLCDGRVSNDPVVIAAKCAHEEDVRKITRIKWKQERNSQGWVLFTCPNCGEARWRYDWTEPNFCSMCGAMAHDPILFEGN